MAKLTLSISEKVIARAKRFAGENGTSVSKLVAEYLDGLTPPLDLSGVPPHIVSLIGIAAGSDPGGHKHYLGRKYS